MDINLNSPPKFKNKTPLISNLFRTPMVPFRQHQVSKIMSSANINPIIPGFAPDPSLVRVADTFFLVNSTFHMFPGLPIYASKDLTSWSHIGKYTTRILLFHQTDLFAGNAICRQSQLSLSLSSTHMVPVGHGETMLATGGLFAPTIRYHNGTFYVICTNVIHEEGATEDKTENFIVSTRDIYSNEWSDLVYFDFGGIDTSIFFDDATGKIFMHGSAGPGPMTKIHLFEIDLETGEKLSEEKKIWDGTGGIYPEGPHIYKKDGYYYLMISEGGTHEDHSITVARSKDIWGPYDAYENNPILTARGTGNYICYTGHCEFFCDGEGNWWGVCLGVRKDKGNRFIMGRESFLTTGKWPQGEWPSMTQVVPNPILADGKELARAKDALALTAAPGVDYLYVRDANLSDHEFLNDGKTINLTASKADMSQWKETITFVGKRQRKLEAKATVSLKTSSLSKDYGLKAGLALYKDEHRFVRIFYDVTASSMVLEVLNDAKSISRVSKHDFQVKDWVYFLFEYTESSFRASYRALKEEGWTAFDVLDTIELTGPDFVGPVIGIFATADTGNVKVQFDDLELDV